MALITRVSRLFRADLNAVLDRIEEPDVLLRQAVREMEEDLARDEQRVKLLDHEHGQLLARQNDLAQAQGEIEEELDVCFASGKDDLARSLVKRKLETQRFLKLLSRRNEQLEEARSTLRSRLEENHTRLESMRQKAELLAERNTGSEAPEPWDTATMSTSVCVGEADIEVALLREKQKRSRS
ncbi:MAG: PspA/IM30 family protein [Pseudomonadota bacterium]|nr:MAG: PspA/IM30 family protein [Pseudomonadota bacterium]